MIRARIRFAKPDSNGRVRFMFRLGEEVQKTLDDAIDAVCELVTNSTGVQVYKGRLVS